MQALNPLDPTGARIDAVFPGDLALRYFKYSPVRYMNLIAAKFVLENPQRIFYGVREFNEGGWCYTAVPPSGTYGRAWWRPFRRAEYSRCT